MNLYCGTTLRPNWRCSPYLGMCITILAVLSIMESVIWFVFAGNASYFSALVRIACALQILYSLTLHLLYWHTEDLVQQTETSLVICRKFFGFNYSITRLALSEISIGISVPHIFYELLSIVVF